MRAGLSRVAFVLMALLMSTAAQARCPQPPPKGFLPLVARPTVLVLGEVHGTREIPAAVEQLACALTQQQRPLVIGYELDAAEQPRLDAYLASDGGSAARQALLQGDFWRAPRQDGRQSSALLHLVDYVRQLRHRGAAVEFVAVQAAGKPGDDRDASLAAGVAAQRARHPDAVIVVVTAGNHARVDDARAMGSRLRRQGVPLVALKVEYDTGTAWSCVNGCGLHPLEGRARGSVPFVELQPTSRMFDGRLYVGAASGSPPAADAK